MTFASISELTLIKYLSVMVISLADNGTALCRQDFKARLFGKLDTVD